MTYYFSKTIEDTYENVLAKTLEVLKSEGFGMVSEINMHEKFKEKLDIDFRRYKILGMCSPMHAYKVVTNEPNIGVMLPCNVVVQEWEKNKIEVAIVNPMIAMESVKNRDIECTAGQIYNKLWDVYQKL